MTRLFLIIAILLLSSPLLSAAPPMQGTGAADSRLGSREKDETPVCDLDNLPPELFAKIEPMKPVSVELKVAGTGKVTEVKIESGFADTATDQALIAHFKSCKIPPAIAGAEVTKKASWSKEAVRSAAPAAPAPLMMAAKLDTSRPCDMPKYPEDAAVNSWEGVVTMTVQINGDGKVIDGKIEKSSGHESLDTAALKAFSACSYMPVKVNDQPATFWSNLKYTWSLQ